MTKKELRELEQYKAPVWKQGVMVATYRTAEVETLVGSYPTLTFRQFHEDLGRVSMKVAEMAAKARQSHRQGKTRIFPV